MWSNDRNIVPGSTPDLSVLKFFLQFSGFEKGLSGLVGNLLYREREKSTMREIETPIGNPGEDVPLLHPCRTYTERRTSYGSLI